MLSARSGAGRLRSDGTGGSWLDHCAIGLTRFLTAAASPVSASSLRSAFGAARPGGKFVDVAHWRLLFRVEPVAWGRADARISAARWG
jgi:hypothetical protein